MDKQLPDELWARVLLWCDDRPTWISALTVNTVRRLLYQPFSPADLQTFYKEAGKLLYQVVRTDNIPNLFAGANLPQSRNTKSALLRDTKHLHFMLRSFGPPNGSDTTAAWSRGAIARAQPSPPIECINEISQISVSAANLPSCLPKLQSLALGYTLGEMRPAWLSRPRSWSQSNRVTGSTDLADRLLWGCTPKYVCTNPDDYPLAFNRPNPQYLPDIITWHLSSNVSSFDDLKFLWGTTNRIYLSPYRRPAGLCARGVDSCAVDEKQLRTAFENLRPVKIGDRKTRFEIYVGTSEYSYYSYGSRGEPKQNLKRITHLIKDLVKEQMMAQAGKGWWKGAYGLEACKVNKFELVDWSEEEMDAVEVVAQEWDRRPKCPSCGGEGRKGPRDRR